MLRRPLFRARLIWIVIFTTLLTALLPLLSHGLLAQDSAAWAEVCSDTGAKFVRLDVARDVAAEASEEGAPSGQAAMECPWCQLAHAPGFPVSAPRSWVADARLRHDRPRLFYLAPRTLFAWAPAQARAPPFTA